jgi:hypothetical protein
MAACDTYQKPRQVEPALTRMLFCLYAGPGHHIARTDARRECNARHTSRCFSYSRHNRRLRCGLGPTSSCFCISDR